MAALQKNQIHRVTVDGYTSDGSGIARVGGFVVFIPFAAKGDELDIRIVKVLKTHAFGRIEKIITPALCRIQPSCPAFYKCGGCDFMHITYEEELELKAVRVQETLRRLGKLDIDCDAIEPSPDILRSRNKAQFPVEKSGDKAVFGFYRRHSHQVIATADCLINNEDASLLAAAVCKWAEECGIPIYDEETHSGLLRKIFTRHGEKGPHLTVVLTQGAAPYSEKLIELCREACSDLTGIVINVNDKQTNLTLGEKCITLWGDSAMYDSLLGKRFMLSPLSFYQVNHKQAENLYKKIIELCDLNKECDALDLCCGVGTITLSLAPYCRSVVGAEIVPRAIEDAEVNARNNGVNNVRFICSDAGKAAEKLAKENFSPYAAVLDPPRKGMDKTSLDAVLSMSPERIVYVACEVSSLARDGKYLEENGYKATYAKAYDMFPRTANVECVCLFCKQTHSN